MSNAEVPAKTKNNRVEESRRLKGFFSDSPPRVTICIDHIDGEAELETVFAHELTHLVDYLRGNEMETREDLLLSEFHASYYAECYNASPLVRKSCIIHTGLANTKVCSQLSSE